MEELGFRREITLGRCLDPFTGFQEKESPIEIRHDGITGVTCRILPFRFSLAEKPDIASYLEKFPESVCPFCAGLFDAMTPRFLPHICPEGKFRRGDAVLFPNAFPYDRNNAVAIFSHDHLLGLTELTPAFMEDGFLVCRDYFAAMQAREPSLTYASVNWNYMPPAGGGLVHPHLQTLLGETPTRRVASMRDSAVAYHGRTGRNLWRDFCGKERKTNERFIADTGSVVWLSSFAPGGMAGEVLFFFPERTSLLSVSEDEIREFLDGLSRVLSYFDSCNFISFNMAFYGTLKEDDHLWVQGRIMPRFLLPPLGTSDMNYFEKFHGEIICPSVPEDLCREIAKLF